ncbi:MAG TPA: hypothetical protein VFR32_11105 [Gaiellaceae bacterium]|nr:hypothetical protein [Gaiellaceae bacterium]
MQAMRPDRLLWVASRSLAVSVCALTAHAVRHRSLAPADGLHGYLGWYEAIVLGLSAAAVAALALVVAAAATGRAVPRPLLLSHSTDASIPRRAASLAAPALLVLLLQESLERSVASGAPDPPGSSLGAWLVVLVALSVAALVLTWAGHSYARLTEAVSAPRRPALLRASAGATGTGHAAPPGRRRNALADRRALRAPPVFAW